MPSGTRNPRAGRCTSIKATLRPVGWLICLLLLGWYAGAPATDQLPQTPPARSLGPIFGPRLPFAAADLDGDNRPDLANVETGARVADGVRYQIQLQLSSTGTHAIEISGPLGGLAIEARDVNGDNAVDLVISSAYFGRPVAVLLNDGHGSFSQAEPSDFPAAVTGSTAFSAVYSARRNGAQGLPPQSRFEIESRSGTLPDPGFCTTRIRTADLRFIRNFLSRSPLGRAPPTELVLS